ncbi:hypothetical protein QWE_07696 [Agrobacterium albertimagni AOL15]|uniref:Antitoxin n=1 Tax=Agrobacterium albertimagni AOL15 TaxID=1156935 RepID=K2Q868_9HYPH|nr:type II toxin-antitoxin system prevent-host-death family antitoxin [Agrobacterium albertimagni]EKF59964.1 hypothetical protein QWE_07696 [Agrobacterium albertimagni AOL15]
MTTVSIATAKERLSDLIAKAEQGETIEIERNGKPVARILPADQAREAIDFVWLESVIREMPQTDDSGIRRLRDEDRY